MAALQEIGGWGTSLSSSQSGSLVSDRDFKDSSMEFRCDLDSHADTCVVSRSLVLVTHDYEQPVRLYGYNEKESSICKTVTGVVAYDCPRTGRTYMLSIHQAILSPARLRHALLSPMQMREMDIRVNDEPKHMVPKPTDDHSAIVIPQDEERNREQLRIPLSLHGVFPYFPYRKPTMEEFLDAPDELRIDLTNPDGEWDPSNERFAKDEDAMTDSRGDLIAQAAKWTNSRVVSALHSVPQNCQDDSDLGRALQSNVVVSALRSVKNRHNIDPPTLAKRWGIGLQSAERTLRVTTQRLFCIQQWQGVCGRTIGSYDIVE